MNRAERRWRKNNPKEVAALEKMIEESKKRGLPAWTGGATKIENNRFQAKHNRKYI
jgi:hypothetical protein